MSSFWVTYGQKFTKTLLSSKVCLDPLRKKVTVTYDHDDTGQFMYYNFSGWPVDKRCYKNRQEVGSTGFYLRRVLSLRQESTKDITRNCFANFRYLCPSLLHSPPSTFLEGPRWSLLYNVRDTESSLVPKMEFLFGIYFRQKRSWYVPLLIYVLRDLL